MRSRRAHTLPSTGILFPPKRPMMKVPKRIVATEAPRTERIVVEEKSMVGELEAKVSGRGARVAIIDSKVHRILTDLHRKKRQLGAAR